MSATHATRPTPNPAERSLVVTVSEDSFASVGGKIPLAGTLYSDPLFKTFFAKDYQKNFSGFAYAGQVGDYGLGFGMDKSAAALDKPFRTTPSTGNQYWHPILLGVDITENKLGRTVNAGNAIRRGGSYTATPIWIPSADTGSLFLLREYLSPVPFDIPQWPTPIASAVSFPVPGQGRFDFPECLHPDIQIPQMLDSESSYDPATTTVTSNVGLVDSRFFPATNPKTWLPFVLYDRQAQTEGGLWHRQQMEVFPPPLPARVRGFRGQ